LPKFSLTNALNVDTASRAHRYRTVRAGAGSAKEHPTKKENTPRPVFAGANSPERRGTASFVHEIKEQIEGFKSL